MSSRAGAARQALAPHASYKRPVSVLVVMYTPALDVLLLERAKHLVYWQSVTGSQEEGEVLIETARREDPPQPSGHIPNIFLFPLQ